MKKFCIICLIIICLMPQLVHAEALNETTETINAQIQQDEFNNSSQGFDAQLAILGVGQLVKNVRSAFLYETNSDTLMYAYEPDLQLPPASFVKIMTALVAVEQGNLDAIITVSATALESVPKGAVTVKLQVGESLTLRDLLYCMIVGSGNDAAAVIAEHISGGQEEFVRAMNQRKDSMGCENTNFTNAHGLHDDEQYITARSAARILDEALNNEDFYAIFTANSYLVPATEHSETRLLETSNNMMDSGSTLYYDPRVIGGRTGVTDDGRRCLISVAENNGMRLICVVMGSKSEFLDDGYSVVTIGGFKETTELLNAGFNGYKTAQVLYEGQILKQCLVSGGTNDVYLGSSISVSTVLPNDVDTNGLTYRLGNDSFQAPIVSGDRLTSLEVWYGSMCIAKTDLYAMNSVPLANGITQVVTGDSKNANIPMLVIGVILLIILGGSAVWRGRYHIKQIFVKARSKRYSRNRRRSK